MRGGRLLIDMHVHLARYKVLSDSTREWFISLYPSETVYQAVCNASVSYTHLTLPTNREV